MSQNTLFRIYVVIAIVVPFAVAAITMYPRMHH
jgi:hypothetical protein